MNIIKHCSIDDCERVLLARTLCRLHYSRWRKHGNPETRKSAANGERKNEQLYNTWCSMKPKCQEWSGTDGFMKFINDVGNRPNGAILRRTSKKETYNKANVVWSIPSQESCTVEGCKTLGNITKKMCSLHYQRFLKHGNPLHEYDRTNSLETIEKRRATMIKRYSDPEEIKKQSIRMKGIKKTFKPGYVSALKGRRRPEYSGANHASWKGGITPQNKKDRIRFHDLYQQLVFQRDNYTCQICDQYGGYLQVDHIKQWSEYPELRFDINNCRTLCMACHYYITFKRKLPKGIIWGHSRSRRMTS